MLAFLPLANPLGLAVQMVSLLNNIWFPWMVPHEEENLVFDCAEVSTDRCGPHVHVTLDQEQIAFEALGMKYNEKLWMSFIKKPLAIEGELAMRISFYACRTNGELYRFGWVRSAKPRPFSQAECAPMDYRKLTGKVHDQDRMSGNLDGAEVIEIVAVQLDFGEVVFLDTPFTIHLIVPKLHAHVPMDCSAREITVRYGDQLVTMPAKPSDCKKVLIHPHSEDDAVLMAAVRKTRQEVYDAEIDRSLAIACGGAW
jgi:hypothetical protein